MKTGRIEFNTGGPFGGYQIINTPVSELPQEVATAIGVVNSGLLGATYVPIRYVGRQLVNGWNHMFIAKEVRTTRVTSEKIVVLVINIPAGDVTGEQAKVVSIIEEAQLDPEVKDIFEAAMGSIVGVNYTPILFIGTQIVKGINYYFVCSAQVVYPGAEPYAAVVSVNFFNGKSTVVSIEPIEDVEPQLEDAPLGEWP